MAITKLVADSITSGAIANTPSFFARKTTTQSLSNDTNTLVTFDTEDFDTDSAFASSRFTVPSGKAGKYFIYSACYFQPNAEANLSYAQANIYKNGSIYHHVNNDFRSYRIFTFTSINSTIIDLAVGDYIEIYAFTSGTSTVILEDDNTRVDRMNVFYGYKIIE